ncbi:MAG TPA: hypothetical protein VM536_00565 [Chloroflexia bacterium]|nr:hypothetical protein [Chloroflexia bacterium]
MLVQLYALAALLILAAAALLWLRPPADPPVAAAGPLAATGLVGSTAQNNCTAYLQSFGYLVDLVGHPRNGDGTPNTAAVIILMPVASPGFDAAARRVDDPETAKQVWAGLRAAGQFLPNTQARAVGLEWNQYIIMLPVDAGAWAQYLAGARTDAELWQQIVADSWVLDTTTGERAPPLDFTRKDFTGAASKMGAVPPSGDRPPVVSGQVRLALSTAYLPAGETATLRASALTSADAPMPGQQIQFIASWPDQDPVVLTTTQTGPDGTARVPFQPPTGTQGGVLLTASSTDILARASASMVAGPPVSSTAAISATTAALRLQGYDLLAVTYDAAARRAGATVGMTTPRADRSMQVQMAALFGTLFTVYPQATDAMLGLIFRSADTPYELRYLATRADWSAWMAGGLNDTAWWERVQFAALLNAVTAQPVMARDFLAKEFGFPLADTVAATQSLESRLVPEPWGDQLYPARFRVPPGGLATGFTVSPGAPGADWAVYGTTDPVRPLYQASADPTGAGLRALQLSGGDYLLALFGATAPAAVRVDYTAYLLAPSGAVP